MLGSDYDIGIGIAPVDLNTAGATGLRQYMGGIDSLFVVFVGGASAALEPPVLTLKQHTLSSGGATANLAVVTEFWTKGEATLDNDETWTRTAQAAGAVVTGTEQVQQMIAFRVRTDSLTAGPYISVSVADPGAGSQLGMVLYVLEGLGVRDVPANMKAPLR